MSSSRTRITTETGYQLFNRLHQRPRLENLYPQMFATGPEPNKIIQITGSPNTGKSLLITELIVNTVLPKNLSANFKECGAIFINTDHQISVIQIIKMAEKKLSMLNIPDEMYQDIVKASLKRLTILNCYSIRQLEVTLLNLEHILSENIDVALLAIDSLSAYYWSERYAASTNEMYSVNKHCTNLLKKLKSVIDDRQIVTVFSKYETDSCLTAMIDYTVTLKRVGCNDNTSKDEFLFLMECYDHEKQIKVAKTYGINTFLVFQC